MKQETWIIRFIKCWITLGNPDEEYGRMVAEAWLEVNPDLLNEAPEDVAKDCFEDEIEQARQDLI